MRHSPAKSLRLPSKRYRQRSPSGSPATLAVGILLVFGANDCDAASEAQLTSNFDKNRFDLRISAFVPRVSTEARLDSDLLGGTTVDFEEIGLPKQKTLFDVELAIQLNRKWYFGGEYFELNRSASRTLEDEIDWNGETFPVSAIVDTHFDFAIFRLAAGYHFLNNKNSQVTLTIGTHLTDVSFGILAQGSISELSSETQGSAETLTVPLPNAGLLWRKRLAESWIVQLRGDFFAIKIDEYDGQLISTDLRIDCLVTDRISVGVSYSYFDLDVEYQGKFWQGNVNFQFYGPKVNIGYRW